MEAWLGFFLLASYSRSGTLPMPRSRSGLHICGFARISATRSSDFLKKPHEVFLSLLWLHPVVGSTGIPSIFCTYRESNCSETLTEEDGCEQLAS